MPTRLPRVEYREKAYYLGKTQVVLSPVRSNSVSVLVEGGGGKTPDLETSLDQVLIPQLTRQYPEIKEANCVQVLGVSDEFRPGQKTPEGPIQSQTVLRCILNFYKAVPATPENTRQLEKIFSA
jgi:hypothetical protein